MIEDPLLTEASLEEAGERGDRCLLGPGLAIPPHLPEQGEPFASQARRPKSEEALGYKGSICATEVDSFGGSKLGRGDGGFVSPVSEFRWKKTSWPDGGRSNTLDLRGDGGVLLSKRGWGRWRTWAGATESSVGNSDDDDSICGEGRDDGSGGGGDRGDGDDGAFPGLLHQQQKRKGQHGETEPVKETAATEKVDGDNTDAEKNATAVMETSAAANNDSDGENHAGLISDLGSALSVRLSGICLVLEPWNYGGVSREGGMDECAPAFAPVESGGWEGGDGSMVAVRLDMAMKMTSALFLSGHWAKELHSTTAINSITSPSSTSSSVAM